MEAAAMSFTEGGGLPPYPHPPPKIARLDHLPTVEASIRYWEAIEIRAARVNDYALWRTAAGLRLSYEAARLELLKVPNGGAKRPRSGD
jgi:hypothetical protein